MRIQSKEKVTVRGKVIGGPDLLVCLPLLAGDTADLLAQADELMALDPDLLEWRADGYNGVRELASCLSTLQALREKIGDVPLIFTCRSEKEGGLKIMAPELRLNLITGAIASGHIDIVDFELCNEPQEVKAIVDAAASHGVKVILSFHDFAKTPEAAFIRGKLVEAENAGADIAKVAVMPEGEGDVLALLAATLTARTEALKIPIVTMAMGPVGGVTRLAGGLFGSDITFAAGKVSTAPGQIPADRLRQAMAVLYT